MDNKKENMPVKVENNKNTAKEKFFTKFINTIKKKWLISGTNTLLLIAILIAITILLNSIIASFEFTPIDCTTEKEHTLTSESKDRVKDIDKSINIYIAGYSDDDATVSLIKQYNKANKNINVETVDLNERSDLTTEYQLSNDATVIVVVYGQKSKVLYSDDLQTYDDNYNTVDLTEEKITSAIMNVTSKITPKIYFLSGYSDYSLDYDGGMSYLDSYLKDEVLEYETLDILVKGSVPEDCQTLVITTPSKDFDDLTTDEIIKYINNGGNILWLNSSYAKSVDLKNVNKILALYGVDPFEVGYIYETDIEKTILGYAGCMVESLGNTDIDQNLSNVVLFNSTKVNINDDKIEELNIDKKVIISSDSTSYFRKNMSNTSSSTDGDDQGGYTIGAILTKPLGDSKEEESETEKEDGPSSKLVIFGDNNFVSDMQLASNIPPILGLYNNKDLALNSIAYLTEQKDSITIRKNHSAESSFTATDGQKSIIMKIVFTVPILIIIIGIIVWQIRRRKK